MAITVPPRTNARSSRRASRAVISERLSSRTFSLPGGGLNEMRKERLFREMHLLIQAGVDPGTMLDLLAKAQRDDRAKRVLIAVRDHVMRGSGLSEAMVREDAFSPYEHQSVRIGEESGRMAEVFLQLAEHHADRLKLRRAVRQAFAYPLFVLFITLAVVLFMMNVVVPMFAQVFARSGAELPALTAAVLHVSEGVQHGWPVALAFALAAGLAIVFLKDRDEWKAGTERVLGYIPVIGELRRKATMARYCRSMAFLLGAGSPLDRALELSERMGGSLRLQRALRTIRDQVVRGEPLHQAMGRHALFDPEMLAMIGVAEEVKQLDRMFGRLADRYTADVQHQATLLGSVLEPITIVLIAILVGVVLVAMYLPMFKLSTTF